MHTFCCRQVKSLIEAHQCMKLVRNNLKNLIYRKQNNCPLNFILVLGAGGNTFAEIRRRRQSSPMRTVRVKDVLSAIDPLPLNIRITKQGEIIVKINGLNKVIVNATDKNPLSINYISFSAWGTTEGKWFFDCKNSTSDELEEVISDLPTYARLLARIFNEYDENSMPPNLNNVYVNFTLLQVVYDSKFSILKSRGIFRMVCFRKKIELMTEKP